MAAGSQILGKGPNRDATSLCSPEKGEMESMILDSPRHCLSLTNGYGTELLMAGCLCMPDTFIYPPSLDMHDGGVSWLLDVSPFCGFTGGG
ncbi:hypothetical protein PT974_09144 [Cladobotryum mycophilum]|uniref:Uncharacterized protein n=1 Tax=Cladobotryum mycophilum TaxID=491253 RepID=A0ABR0SFD4_9HYPO